MASKKYLALLRGINVGGNNIIAKDDLKRCFEKMGLSNVRTYIQSGNVLFRSAEANLKKQTKAITTALSKEFSYTAQAVVLSHSQYKSALQQVPQNWGVDNRQKHNAMFLLDDLQPADVLAKLPPPIDKFESVGCAKGVIFWSASKKDLSKTTMMKLAATPLYKQMTVRNSNTTIKLLELFDEI